MCDATGPTATPDRIEMASSNARPFQSDTSSPSSSASASSHNNETTDAIRSPGYETVQKWQKQAPQQGTTSNRCGLCKKRLGLLYVECLCRNRYCLLHRYPESHNCKNLHDKQALDKTRLSESLLENKMKDNRNLRLL